MDRAIAEVTTLLSQPQILNPNEPLVERTKRWIAVLYSKAEGLVWEEYVEEEAEFAPWKLLTPDEKKASSLESLTPEKRGWAITYHNLVAEKALQIADGLTEAIRASIMQIIKNQQRHMLRYQQVEGYKNVKEIARQTISLPDGSSGRQISAFIETHLEDVEEAGVPEETALTVLSRPDKFVINAARAVSRAKTSDDLSKEEKKERIRQVMEAAATKQYASEIRREFLNGHYEIPRDEITVDGARYITFIPRTEDEYLVLNKRTNDISTQWGNAQPILAETQAARIRHETITDMKIVLAILESSPATLWSDFDDRTSCPPEDIIEALISIGLVEKSDEYYLLTK